MYRTIFNIPLVRSIFRGVAIFFLKVLGWKAVGQVPDLKKYVVVFAPHTSNWDVFYGAILAFGLKLDVCFMAKKELFRFPFGPLVRLLGGMPVDRTHAGNTVEQVVRKFKEHDRFAIAIAPEGTRKKAGHWKSGFYRIAEGAGVPVLLSYIDYATKTGGLGPLVSPGGDIDRDMSVIRGFYAEISGKYAGKAGPVSVSRNIPA